MYSVNDKICNKHLEFYNVSEIMFHPFIYLLGNNILQDAKEMEHRKTMTNLNDSIPPAKKLCAYSITNPFYFRIHKYAIKFSSLNRVIFHHTFNIILFF